MAADLEALEAALNYRFENRDLLIRALTHRSLASERRMSGETAGDNEQLEFLGDAVLGYIVSEWLVENYPLCAEGRLSVLRARLVSADHLADTARRLALGEFLQLGRGEEKGGGRGKDRLLANAVEAIIAAIYLDGGAAAARRFILDGVVGEFDPDSPKTGRGNYKGRLVERAQQLGLAEPEYSTVSYRGPEHAKVFTVEIRIGGDLVTRGEGSSKKAAGQNAARAMLEKIESLPADTA